jgi:hypothetical protein
LPEARCPVICKCRPCAPTKLSWSTAT